MPLKPAPGSPLPAAMDARRPPATAGVPARGLNTEEALAAEARGQADYAAVTGGSAMPELFETLSELVRLGALDISWDSDIEQPRYAVTQHGATLLIQAADAVMREGGPS
jgi:hypothetical protein